MLHCVAMSEMALACEGLTKHFRLGAVRAVTELSLSVPRGTTFGLLGPNGAGKTTTISMFLGLVRPTAGRMEVLGASAQSLQARRRVGFVPEKFQLPPFLTASEFLSLHGRLSGVSAAKLPGRIAEELERVGLQTRRNDRVGGFSKGMQQRLVLAQALLHEPELLILDEPTSALDPGGRREVRDIIRAAHARGATVLLNSHLLSEVEAVCDHVAIMRDGRLVQQGPIRSLARQGLRVDARVGALSDAAIETLRTRVTGLEVRGSGPEPVALAFEVTGEAELPLVVASLVSAGVQVYALVPHAESLEDTFLRLVEGA